MSLIHFAFLRRTSTPRPCSCNPTSTVISTPSSVTPPSSPPAAYTISDDLWHRWLVHLNATALSHLPLDFLSSCNNKFPNISFCDACHLGKQTCLPFSISHSGA